MPYAGWPRIAPRRMLLTCGGRALHLGKTRRGTKRRGTRDVREAGVPVLPAGAGLLQLEGDRVCGVRRAERPRAAQGDVRLLEQRSDRALHRRERKVRAVGLGRPAARLNGARLAWP